MKAAGMIRVEALVIATLGLAACDGGPVAEDSNSPSIAESRQPEMTVTSCDDLRAAVTKHPFGTMNTSFELVARFLPGGFGGLFQTSPTNAATAMYLVDTSQAEAARASAAELADCHTDLSGLLSLVAQAEALQGQFDWVQLMDWYDRIRSERGLSGRVVQIYDIDESENRLSFGVVSEAAGEELIRVANGLGVPSQAIITEVVPTPALR